MVDLVEELVRLTAEFEREGIEYALCGGLALAVHGIPRATLDIDVMIEPDALERVRKVARTLGYDIDAGLSEFKGGAIRMYRMTKLPKGAREPLVLDMLLVTPAVVESWNGRQQVAWEKGDICVVSPRGLIALKRLRGTGQDLDDIERLREISDES